MKERERERRKKRFGEKKEERQRRVTGERVMSVSGSSERNVAARAARS